MAYRYAEAWLLRDVGALHRKEEKNGRFPCRASACTNMSVSSMPLRSRWSAALSLLLSVASVVWAIATSSCLDYRLTWTMNVAAAPGF